MADLDPHLFVTTDMFESVTPDPKFINPCCFGEDFAQWLRTQLSARGLTLDNPIQEDWGWVLFVRHGGAVFTLTIAILNEFIGLKPARWRVGIVYEKWLNGIKAWFRPKPLEMRDQVFAELRQVTMSEPRIRVSDEE